MKLTLMIEGSAAAIAAVLANLPESGAAISVTSDPQPQPAGNAPITGTAPNGAASLPMPIAPTAAAPDDDDDDSGQAATGDSDSTGLPWDERIHAGTRTTTQAGVWKKRKGVPAETVAAVEAELRQGAPSIPPAAAAVALPDQPIAMPAMPMPVTPAPAPTPMPMPVATAEPAAAMPTAQGIVGFGEFMETLAEQMKGDNAPVKQENVVWVAQQLGLNAITDVSTDPLLIAKAIDIFKTYNLWPVD